MIKSLVVRQVTLNKNQAVLEITSRLHQKEQSESKRKFKQFKVEFFRNDVID